MLHIPKGVGVVSNRTKHGNKKETCALDGGTNILTGALDLFCNY